MATYNPVTKLKRHITRYGRLSHPDYCRTVRDVGPAVTASILRRVCFVCGEFIPYFQDVLYGPLGIRVCEAPCYAQAQEVLRLHLQFYGMGKTLRNRVLTYLLTARLAFFDRERDHQLYGSKYSYAHGDLCPLPRDPVKALAEAGRRQAQAIMTGTG